MSFNSLILVPGSFLIVIMIASVIGMNNFITQCEDKKGYLMFIDERLTCLAKTPKALK